MRYFDNSIVSNPGSPIKIIYTQVVDDEGNVDIVPCGQENFQEYIDSFESQTDIKIILAKLQAGDTSVLNVNVGTFGDFTSMPKTYAEMLQLRIDSDNAYDRLTMDQKREFDNSKDKFFATAGTEEWFEKLGLMKNKEEPIIDNTLVENN